MGGANRGQSGPHVNGSGNPAELAEILFPGELELPLEVI